MKIIVSLFSFGDITPDELDVAVLGEDVESMVAMECNDEEGSLYRFEYKVARSDSNDAPKVIAGAVDREAFLQAIESWNKDIKARLMMAMSAVKAADTPRAEEDALEELYMASREATNRFHPGNPHAVYLPNRSFGMEYWRSTLSDEDLEKIQAHPEEYAIVQVSCYPC